MEIITVTIVTDPEGNKIEIVSKGPDFGKSFGVLKTTFPWLLGLDNKQNAYTNYETIKQINHDTGH